MMEPRRFQVLSDKNIPARRLSNDKIVDINLPVSKTTGSVCVTLIVLGAAIPARPRYLLACFIQRVVFLLARRPYGSGGEPSIAALCDSAKARASISLTPFPSHPHPGSRAPSGYLLIACVEGARDETNSNSGKQSARLTKENHIDIDR